MTSFGEINISDLDHAFSAALQPAVGQAVSAYLNRACEGLGGINSQLTSSSQLRNALHARQAKSGSQALLQQTTPCALRMYI